MNNPIAAIGKSILIVFRQTGAYSVFLINLVRRGFLPKYYGRQMYEQLIRIGFNSLPVVGLTAFFTGSVLALQIYIGSSRFNAESLVAQIVAIGITRELGPVLAGLMVAGRVSASIAAELGTMRVTEQIDALKTLSTDPFKYLVMPRVVAATLTLPLLVVLADTIGIMGGFVVGTKSLGFSEVGYLKSTYDFIEVIDVVSGLVKSSVFGFIIAFFGCYQGYKSQGGALGVGRATTNAVVQSSIFILAANYLLTSLVFSS